MAKSITLAKCEELQHLFETSSGEITVGIDLGDRYSHCCVLGPDGVVFAEGRVRTTPDAMASHFKSVSAALITIEVGTHSRWVSQLFQDWGHEVVVANPRNLPMITANMPHHRGPRTQQ
jgi:transposase